MIKLIYFEDQKQNTYTVFLSTDRDLLQIKVKWIFTSKLTHDIWKENITTGLTFSCVNSVYLSLLSYLCNSLFIYYLTER